MEIKNTMMAACVAGVMMAGVALGQALQNENISVSVDGQSHIFSFRGSAKGVMSGVAHPLTPSTLNLPLDRLWGWDGNLVRPVYPDLIVKGYGTSFLRMLPPPLRFNISPGTTQLRVELDSSMNLTSLVRPINPPTLNNLWEARGRLTFFGVVEMGYGQTYISLTLPYFEIRPVTGSWVINSRKADVYLSRDSTPGPGVGIAVPVSSRTFSETVVKDIPVGFSGPVDLYLYGYSFNWNSVLRTGSPGYLWGGESMISTNGSMSIVRVGELAGTLTVPPSALKEGFTGNIPIEFSVGTE